MSVPPEVSCFGSDVGAKSLESGNTNTFASQAVSLLVNASSLPSREIERDPAPIGRPRRIALRLWIRCQAQRSDLADALYIEVEMVLPFPIPGEGDLAAVWREDGKQLDPRIARKLRNCKRSRRRFGSTT